MTADEMAAIHAAAMTVPRPWSAEEIAALLAAPGVFALGEGGGFIIGRAAGGEAEILTLAVHPEVRRRGTGRTLVRRFLQDCAARGADDAFLEVAAGNQAAIALYSAEGFAGTGLRRGYFLRPDGQREDALVMRRAVLTEI